jgi:RNA polymerase sigma factor (sigma-70 family)
VVEDLCQDALRIILERGIGDPRAADVDGRPALAWCLQVLRNTIGNYYQRERTRSSRANAVEEETVDHTPSAPRTPLESLETRETLSLLVDAIDALSDSGEGCRRYLHELLEGRSPAEIASVAGVPAAAFYRRLYRCRQRLRELLLARGVLA